MKPLSDYADDPVGFVCEVLGGEPWAKQVEILEAIRDHHRVTVRSCHGIGKTYIAAAASLWRLHCFRPSIVITTAPGHRQVKDVLWKRIRALQRRAKRDLPGTVLETAIKIEEDIFAVGFATDESDRFQGYHERHVFIVVEEAAGVPGNIYEAIDGCMTTAGAKLLLIGNPTDPTSYFAESHKRERWKKIAIGAFDSPNVDGAALSIHAEQRDRDGDGTLYRTDDGLLWPPMEHPDLVTLWWVEEKQAEWGIDSPIYAARVLGQFPDASDNSLFPLSWVEAATVRWHDEREKVSSLGQETTEKAANEGDVDTEALGAGLRALKDGSGKDRSTGLVPSRSALSAQRPAPAVEIGVDVARYGGCETVVVVRRGPFVSRLEAWMGQDLMTTAGRVVAIAREEAARSDCGLRIADLLIADCGLRIADCGDGNGTTGSLLPLRTIRNPQSQIRNGAVRNPQSEVWIKIDEIGMGGGVVDRLREPELARELKGLGIRVLGVNVAERPRDPERYERRDEILFGLRERFRSGQVAVPPDDRLAAQLTALRYRYTSAGRLQVESKDELRERGLRSPDRADALALAFSPVGHGVPGYAGTGHGRPGVQRVSI